MTNDGMDSINPNLLRQLAQLRSPDSEASARIADSLAAEEAANRKAFDGMRIERAGIPARFRDCTLRTSPQKVAAQMMERGEPLASYYLHGPVGTGKTGLAAGYLQHWILTRGKPGRFVTAPRLFAELRATYDGENSELSVLERYSRTPLLVLDDLGSESTRSADWVADRLYQILGERHDELRPTVITSNLNLDALTERVGERLVWRIVEACGPGGIIEVGGRNLRASAR